MKWQPFAALLLTGVVMLNYATFTNESSAQKVSEQATGDVESPAPVEVGLVDWGRDLDAALAQSDQTSKPVLVLFQEVPGCAGCQKFGQQVLSHPLIVEAIESEFIPVVVYNNRSGGTDKQLLTRFGEPAWNYQVMRFLDADAKDIVPRRDRIWSLPAVASRLTEVLEKAERPVPKYLQSLVATSQTKSLQQAAFAMHCFWTGEYQLGKIDGVVATEAGWLDGREVTLVHYNPTQLTLESLAVQAAKVRCADKIYTTTGESLAGLRSGKLTNQYRTAKASDQKRQLSRLPRIGQIEGLNAMQLTKLNAWLPDNRAAALSWLSPRQQQQLNELLK